MKKILCLLAVCVLMSGCGYHKCTVIKLDGENIKVPLKGIGTIEGEKIKGTISRTVSLVCEKNREVKIDGDVEGIKNTIENTKPVNNTK